MKTHFAPALGMSADCGRGQRTTDQTAAVDCLSCISRNAFQEAHQKFVLAKEAAFQAQVPATVPEPWREGTIVCNTCDGFLFRYRGRSCMGHYDDWVCSDCGHTTSRLTETGMCF